MQPSLGSLSIAAFVESLTAWYSCAICGGAGQDHGRLTPSILRILRLVLPLLCNVEYVLPGWTRLVVKMEATESTLSMTSQAGQSPTVVKQHSGCGI